MSKLPPTDTETTISPEQYRAILEGLNLESINLAELHADVDHELWQSNALGNTTIRLVFHQEVVRWEQVDNVLTFIHNYQLTGKVKRKHVLQIEAVYRVRYVTTQAVSPDFVRIFQQSTLVLTTYPYFRELVDSTTRRMGVPPVTLPMVLVR